MVSAALHFCVVVPLVIFAYPKAPLFIQTFPAAAVSFFDLPLTDRAVPRRLNPQNRIDVKEPVDPKKTTDPKKTADPIKSADAEKLADQRGNKKASMSSTAPARASAEKFVDEKAADLMASGLISGNESPEYPRLARLRGEEGVVVVRVAVDGLAGALKTIELERSSGFSSLDAAVLEKVRTWHFVRAESAGPRRDSEVFWRDTVVVHIPFRFSLERL